MAIVIDATVGGASANSFVTLAEMSDYMDSRLNGSVWAAASTDDQNRALVESTRELSARTWRGLRANTTQALSWPRWNVINPDSSVGFLYTTDVVPDRVKRATMEYAFQFLKAGTQDLAVADPNAGVIEKRIGPITTRWQSSVARPQGIHRFARVVREIAPLLDESSYTMRAVRG